MPLIAAKGRSSETDVQTSNLKSTLNLPKTAFPMKANLPQNEPRMLAEWEAESSTSAFSRPARARLAYVLHDGPPYPTGTIHLGTAPQQDS